jgi:hypothetical protein
VDENDNFDANGARILTDGTDGNGVIDANEFVLMREVAPGGTIRVSANCGNVSYAPSGFTRTAGGLCNPVGGRVIVFCDDRGRRVAAGSLSSARAVTIDRPGRGQVWQETADVNGAIGVAGATCP